MLQKIIEQKKAELLARKAVVSERSLRRSIPDSLPPSFSRALSATGPSIIAEIKYRSPSHGEFRCQKPPCELAEEYWANGADAVSILTDSRFFGGKLEFLKEVSLSLNNALPLLRKDFLLEPYQVVEARCNGASAYLLIAGCLEKHRLKEMMECGTNLGLEALVEVHNAQELEGALEAGAGVIGVNNRDLHTFEVDVRTSFQLARLLEGERGKLLVSESGISDTVLMAELHDAGFQGFLIGTALMESDHPGALLRKWKEFLRAS